MSRISRAYTQTYSSRQPLKCAEFQNTRSHLGVHVSDPYDHAMHHGEPWVDVSFERPAVSTSSFGGSYPLSQAGLEAIRNTEFVIKAIDVIIEELLEHRLRLKNEIAQLRAMGLPKHKEE